MVCCRYVIVSTLHKRGNKYNNHNNNSNNKFNNNSHTDDSNVNAAKLRKYKALDIEVSRMWKVRTKRVPVIIGALETIKKESVHKVRLLPAHPSAIELQKVTLMSTAHFIRKVLR
jgi:hypothetical protein